MIAREAPHSCTKPSSFAAPTAASDASPTPASDTAVICGSGTVNKGGQCLCAINPGPQSASSFQLLESHKTLVAVLPAVGLIAAVKLFMN